MKNKNILLLTAMLLALTTFGCTGNDRGDAGQGDSTTINVNNHNYNVNWNQNKINVTSENTNENEGNRVAFIYLPDEAEAEEVTEGEGESGDEAQAPPAIFVEADTVGEGDITVTAYDVTPEQFAELRELVDAATEANENPEITEARLKDMIDGQTGTDVTEQRYHPEEAAAPTPAPTTPPTPTPAPAPTTPPTPTPAPAPTTPTPAPPTPAP